MQLDGLFILGFPSAPHLQCLTSPASATRRTVLQKVRGSTYKVVPQLVNIWFQVLFHSPPGVLFTVPSQYYALSVTKEYLALRGGPRMFSQGSTCLDLRSEEHTSELQSSIRQSITYGREPGELKHLSSRRKRKKHRFCE